MFVCFSGISCQHLKMEETAHLKEFRCLPYLAQLVCLATRGSHSQRATLAIAKQCRQPRKHCAIGYRSPLACRIHLQCPLAKSYALKLMNRDFFQYVVLFDPNPRTGCW